MTVLSRGRRERRSLHTQLERVMDRLHESGRLVILEEAHKLNDAAIFAAHEGRRYT